MSKRRINIYFSLIIVLVTNLSFCEELADTRIKDLVQSLSDKNVFAQQKSVEKLVRIGKDAVQYLISSLENCNRDACANAVEALGLIGDESAINSILKILDRNRNIQGYEVLENQYIRVNSIKALGRLKAKDAIPVLEEIMQNERIIDKAWCQAALYQIDPKLTPLESLFGMAKNDDSKVRNVIVRFLSEQRDPQVLPVLKESLSDKEWYIRDNAVQGIGRLGNKKHIKWLKPLLEDPVPIVAETAKSAIEKLKK